MLVDHGETCGSSFMRNLPIYRAKCCQLEDLIVWVSEYNPQECANPNGLINAWGKGFIHTFSPEFLEDPGITMELFNKKIKGAFKRYLSTNGHSINDLRYT